MQSVIGMIRGMIAGVAVAVLSMTALFGINFAVTQISPEHYRRIVVQALESGTLATVTHLTFAPGKDVYPFGGNDCLILGALVMPRDARMKASVSPRLPVADDDSDGAPGYPPAALCRWLAATMRMISRNQADDQFPPPSYYHRYIQGDTTVAALLLAIMSFAAATNTLLAGCYAMLAGIALVAIFRLNIGEPAERRRAGAFLILAAVLACFYGAPVFDRSFSFAPTDFVVFGFILYGLLQPFGTIPRQRFILAAALFGSLIAILEFLTGGIPLGVATLIALIALGGTSDWRTLRNRVAVGTAAFAAAIVACFGYKLLAVAAVFGTNELSVFFETLGHHMGGSIEANLSDSVKAALTAYHINPQWLDANILTRAAFAGLMLTYSSFFLGWGSHVLGATIVLLPTPLLIAVGYFSYPDRCISERARERLGLALAGAVPVVWYVLFINHTILHSSYMVRPLALNLALCVVAALPPWPSRAVGRNRAGVLHMRARLTADSGRVQGLCRR
jgi:hypothetical protein